ncbi:hypothetical protein NQZ68_030886 [Dissostichus eleginoides]|nr:hypothetical protein NQZ68_030886 [Dissostichus eleginoides]
MSDQRENFRGDMAEAVQVIDLEEVMKESEEQEWEREDLRRRIRQAELRLQVKEQLHEQYLTQGMHLQSSIQEMEAENEALTNKGNELQHLENVRKIRKEALQRELVAEDETIELEKENKRLKRGIKLEQFSGEKHQDQKQGLEKDAQELQHILAQVEEDIRRKDEEIEQKSRTLDKRCRENKNCYKTIKQQQELKQQLGIQVDKRAAEKTSTMLRLGYLTLAERNDERHLNNENCLSVTQHTYTKILEMFPFHLFLYFVFVVSCCLRVLWSGVKVAGLISLSILFLHVAAMCFFTDDHCNLLTIVFNLLEPCGELHHTQACLLRLC